MTYYVSEKAKINGVGTRECPFATIGEAVEVVQPGDEVIVAPGIYREYVNPKTSGTQEAPIVFRSEKTGEAVITGSEVVNNWKPYKQDAWVAHIPNSLFGNYNPYTTIIGGDWYYSEIPLHTGEVYINGQSMFETDSIDDVVNPTVYLGAWDQDASLYKWYTQQDSEKNETIIYANFRGKNPNEEKVEINVRRNCFYPSSEGVNYITLSGFTIKQAATTWAPPTAYQEGMIGPHWSKGWIIEDCEVSDSKCCGISLGKYLQPNNENKWNLKRLKHGTQTERDSICQAQIEGWTKERIGHHIIRRCHIHHCEQTGIVGHLGGVFSLIEDNHIHHINTKQQLAGAEIGGIKMHAAIDTIFRRNHIHHCTRGLWLDWQAQGSRITQNLFHHNVAPAHVKFYSFIGVGEDIFIEVSHGPTLIDNNIMLTPYASKLPTQGVAFVHNLIYGSFTFVGIGTNNLCPNSERYTPYHVPHRTEVAGFMTILHGDNRFFNNIFIQSEIPENCREYLKEKDTEYNEIAGTKPFDDYPTKEEFIEMFFQKGDSLGKEKRDKYYSHLPIYTGGNVYFNGAQPCNKEKNFAMADSKVKVYVNLVEKDGNFGIETNLYENMPETNCGIITTATLEEAFEPEQLFENPDGSPITFDRDYYNQKRGIKPVPGPFAC